ncbi:RNA-directed DNA polymerase [Phyllobacterium sp. K27]
MPIDRFSILTANGYFPKELPLSFTTKDFGRDCREILKDWAANGTIPANYKNPKKLSRVKDCEPEIISTPKGNHERRILNITHPVPQAMLNALISRNWNTVEQWLMRSQFSFDKTVIIDGNARAIPEPMFAAHQAHKEMIESFANWLVKSDVSRFYPSIYTHSIPWAAYGKEKVKSNLSKYSYSLADQIDVLLRKCNRNQTVGIPIGPDTSRVVADIVSASIDVEVAKEEGLTKYNADRLQDDWLVGCESLEQAERRLSKIIIAYQAMGLDINGSKTSIHHIKDFQQPIWQAHILSQINGRYNSLIGTNLHSFLTSAISLQIANPKDFVLKYVIAILFNKNIRNQDVPFVQSFLSKAVIVDPRVIADCAKMISNFHFERKPINIDRIRSRFIRYAEDAIETHRHHEAIWSLSLLRSLKINLSDTRIPDLSEDLDSACIRLILLDMKERGQFNVLPTKVWEKEIVQSSLYGPEWLLAYEGVRHGWLRDPSSKIRNNPILEPFFSRDIVFYDEKRNFLKRKAILRERRIATKIKSNFLGSLFFGY